MISRDDVLRMAAESGALDAYPTMPQLERFAALVAATEREACAKVCDALCVNQIAFANHCATAIRARAVDQPTAAL